MKTFVKIYGPPIIKTIKTLEKIVLDMPEVFIMNLPIWITLQKVQTQTTDSGGSFPFSMDAVRKIFGIDDLPRKRCESIISKSSESLGEYDFFFEWFIPPTVDQIETLLEKIDKAVEPLGSLYTLTTK